MTKELHYSMPWTTFGFKISASKTIPPARQEKEEEKHNSLCNFLVAGGMAMDKVNFNQQDSQITIMTEN